MNALSQNNDGKPLSTEAAFAMLPPGRLLRLPEVMARVGLKRSAIYQRMTDGRFPRSRSLGPKCTVWIESEIDDWIRAIAQRTV